MISSGHQKKVNTEHEDVICHVVLPLIVGHHEDDSVDTKEYTTQLCRGHNKP